MNNFDNKNRRLAFLFDPWLLYATLALLCLGLLMVASASMVISDRQFGYPFHFLLHQVLHLSVGIVLAALVTLIPMERWRAWGPYGLLIAMGLLVLVLIPGIGRQVNGSRRWLDFWVVRFQVSELVKLVVVVYLSGYLVRHAEEVRQRISGFVKPMLLLVVISGLLLLEPDFGAVTVIVTIAVGMMFLAGVKISRFLTLLLLVGGTFITLIITAPYRLERLTAFLNPWATQFKGGYQLTQSLIAFGRGGIFGVGLGNSMQKLFYLPEAHTDFLFAVLAEELGLIGQLVVSMLLVIIVARALLMGYRAQQQGDFFSGYMAWGLGLWLGLQAMINIGVNVGVLPTKGLTLPLMSYGGSSLLIDCVVVGILLRIYHETVVTSSRAPMISRRWG